MKVERDQSRFRQIVRGKIRQNLRKYVTHGEMIGRQGRDLVSIPIPQLDVPHFRYGKNGSGGVGQGDGEVGSAISPGGEEGDGRGGPGVIQARIFSKSIFRSKSWLRFWETSSNCPASNPRGGATSRRKRRATTASAGWVRNRCGTSAALTCKRCGGKCRRTLTTLCNRELCRSAKTSVTAPGPPFRSLTPARWPST